MDIVHTLAPVQAQNLENRPVRLGCRSRYHVALDTYMEA